MDVKTFLHEEFHRRQKFNASYSLRAFARDLDLEASIISKIMKGQRGAGKKVCLHLEGKFKTSFTPTMGQRQQSEERLAHLLDEQIHFNIISQWEYFAVLNLTECPSFPCTIDAVSTTLFIPKERAEKVVQELFSSELMQVFTNEQGKVLWKRTHTHLKSTHEIRSLALRLSYIESLELARKKIEEVPLEKRDFSSIVFAIDDNYIPFVKKLFAKFRNDILMILSELPQTKNQVYQANFQVFPLTKALDKKTPPFSQGDLQ
jgi:uncharacterized protein (TIGR02147 family)